MEYPRKGVWVIGFTTGQVEGAVKDKIKKRQCDNCFCANDTKLQPQVFLLMVPKNAIKIFRS